MKFEFRMEGLHFEDARMDQRGELGPINFSMEAQPAEIIEMIKAEGAVIQELLRLGRDFLALEREKESRRRNERRNANKRF